MNIAQHHALVLQSNAKVKIPLVKFLGVVDFLSKNQDNLCKVLFAIGFEIEAEALIYIIIYEMFWYKVQINLNCSAGLYDSNNVNNNQ